MTYKCRAKDPATCSFHGSPPVTELEKKIKQATNFNEYLILRQQLSLVPDDADENEPEVKFDYDPLTVEAYTFGDCWALANKINQISGWKILTIEDFDSDEDSWCHAGIQLPNNKIMDIEGIWSAENWLSRWNEIAIETQSEPGIGMREDGWAGYYTLKGTDENSFMYPEVNSGLNALAENMVKKAKFSS